MRLLKGFVRVISILVLVLVIFFVSAQPVSAVAPVLAVGIGTVAAKFLPVILGLFKSISGAAATVIGTYIVIILALHAIAEVLLSLGGALVEAAINFNFKILDASFIRYGHNITLGITNMGFIVALVVTAFGTMFRSEAFGYKKVLPKLVIAALLINFGFFIVTSWFISPVNDITKSFTEAANFGDTVPAIQAIFDPRGPFSNIPLDFDADIPGLPDKPIEWLAGLLAGTILGVAFLLLGVISLFAFAIMLLIRGVVMSFLIILLPLAWIGFVFPKLKIPGGGNPWSTWWESFIRWLLFAPLAIFFFYLAFQFTALDLDKVLPSSSDDITTAVGQMLVTIGFVIGGLIVANKMGITGSGYALGIAAAGSAWLKVKGGVIAGRMGRGVLKGGVPYGKDEDDKAKKFSPFQWAADKTRLAGQGRGFFRNKLTAPVRGIGRGIDRLTETAEAVPWDAAVKEADETPTPTLAKQMAGLSPRKFAAAAATKMGPAGLLWESPELTQYLARHWEEVLAAIPVKATKERLNLEAKLGRPLKSFRHYKPLFELEDTKEFKELYDDMLASDAYRALDDKGKDEAYVKLVRIQSARLVKAGKIKAEIDPRQIQDAIQKDIEEWLPGKSATAATSGEREHDRVMPGAQSEKREGGDYGLTPGAKRITRNAQQGGFIETRPELLNRRMAGGFPEGLRSWNQAREDHLEKLDQELLSIVEKVPGVTAEAMKIAGEGISKKDVKEIVTAIGKLNLPKGTDVTAWQEIIAKMPDKKTQARATKLQQQGAEGLAALYRTLMQGRRNLFQWSYFVTT